ncbi:hypothetical protein BURPS1106B_A0817 [Burkholderia pseudomallei 1106b]|uniref:Uncharacterized protein n=1 Tax=Burkholderia pseudomallei (strain 1106a) TaxID=357348 RepID=A3NU23_BURP0|nr:hypothetical protein BURPS1106A_1573 [Burkholderia pseudomallei 1106a]EES24882.1 hypothetical protein BURPS1106B_A0817 [Burkholderia pseudomallei 1106b]
MRVHACAAVSAADVSPVVVSMSRARAAACFAGLANDTSAFRYGRSAAWRSVCRTQRRGCGRRPGLGRAGPGARSAAASAQFELNPLFQKRIL